jgi:hypothetical protein
MMAAIPAPMVKTEPREGVQDVVLGEDAAELRRQLEAVAAERDYLLVHSRNLEAELRDRARDPGRVRDLEQRLAHAESCLRQVSPVHMAKWLILRPDAAWPRVWRRLRDGAWWRIRERYRVLRLKLR